MFLECQKQKSNTKNIERGWVIVLFQKFWKNNSRTFFSSSFIFSSILVHFGWFNTWKVCQLGFYKTSLYSRSKDATTNKFKLEILIWFNSFIMEHWIPLYQTSHNFFIPLLNWETFVTLEVLGGRLQMFFELHNHMKNA
jgi:hypothetical protein